MSASVRQSYRLGHRFERIRLAWLASTRDEHRNRAMAAILDRLDEMDPRGWSVGLYVGRHGDRRRAWAYIGQTGLHCQPGHILFVSRDGDAWQEWRIFRRPFKRLRDEIPARFYAGPGQGFGNQPIVQRTPTAVTIYQSGGLDV